jgi:hypothetical protein
VSFSPTASSLRPYTTGGASFPVFISSADEAMTYRNRVQDLITKSLDSQLSYRGWAEHFPVWRWEEIAATTVPAGGKSNDLFVQKARESSVTIVLLRDSLRPGTREELLAVKDDPDVELKVLWFPRRFRASFGSTEVQRFLFSADAKGIYHNRLQPADSDVAWQRLFANIVDMLLLALRSSGRGPYVHSI